MLTYTIPRTIPSAFFFVIPQQIIMVFMLRVIPVFWWMFFTEHLPNYWFCEEIQVSFIIKTSFILTLHILVVKRLSDITNTALWIVFENWSVLHFTFSSNRVIDSERSFVVFFRPKKYIQFVTWTNSFCITPQMFGIVCPLIFVKLSL